MKIGSRCRIELANTDGANDCLLTDHWTLITHQGRELPKGVDIRNAFTVDVEDYFQVSAFEAGIARERWPAFESRVEANTLRIADLLDGHQVKATFFVLGWVADRFPSLVRELHSRGHEIGSHSYWHRLIYSQTPEQFRSDLVRSRRVIEDALGVPVTAYRAPSFSITSRSLWALDILAAEGFHYDSSIFPIRHDRYGIPDARTDIHRVETPSGPLWEFPVSTRRIVGVNVPVSGGGYFRLYPYRFTAHCLTSINRRLQRPFVFYIHPWEVDADQPRLRAGSRLKRFRHYVGLSKTVSKLTELLDQFRFGTLSAAIDEIKGTSSASSSAPLSVPCGR